MIMHSLIQIGEIYLYASLIIFSSPWQRNQWEGCFGVQLCGRLLLLQAVNTTFVT